MKYFQFTLWFGAVLMSAIVGINSATAQTNVSDEAMRLIASSSVSMPESQFEVSSDGAVFTVLRVNSMTNASPHQGRNNEANAIVKAIVAEFKQRGTQYSDINTIIVQYVERSGKPVHDRIIDRIDFRRSADGKFELHVT